MPNTWHEAYKDLKKYISSNPGIEIGPGVVCLPSDIRPEFYRIFDNVRVTYIEDNYPHMLEEGRILVERWNEAKRSAMEALKLQSIETDADINWFLLDPKDGLMRFLFDPLFDLIKGKSDEGSFENQARVALTGAFNKFFSEGYKYWTILSLLKLLSADQVYTVPDTELDKDPYAHMETLAQIDGLEEKAPDPRERTSISFQHKLKFSFLEPSFIVHSASLNSFVAFVPDYEYNESRWQSQRLSPAREWYKMSQIQADYGNGDLWPDIGIYVNDNVKELSVAGDHVWMGQPDIIIETKVHKDWVENRGIETVKRHYNVLKPKIGSYVVCLEPVPVAAAGELEAQPGLMTVPAEQVAVDGGNLSQPSTVRAGYETSAEPQINIHVLDAGYDVNKLLPVTEALIKYGTPTA